MSVTNYIAFSKIFWEKLEKYLNEEIPDCVKTILNICGYDTFFSLAEINDAHIIKIEKHINENCSECLNDLNCCHSDFYKEHAPFKLLPGHEALILALPKHIENFQRMFQFKLAELKGRYSFVLNELIETAEKNLFQDDRHARYSESIRFFAVYVFLLCGRSCYEMLRANLPVPSTKTICKLNEA